MSENKEIGFDILEDSDINTVEEIGTEKMEIDEEARERMLKITMKKYEKEKKLLGNETEGAASAEGYADSVSGVDSYKKHKISNIIYIALCSAAAVAIIAGSLFMLKNNGRTYKPQISDPIIEATTVTTSAAVTATDEAAQTTIKAVTKSSTAKRTTASATTTKTTTTAAVTSTNAPEPVTDVPEPEPEREPTEEDREKEVLDAVYNITHDGYYPTYTETNGTFEHYTSDGTLVDFKNIINYMAYEAETLPFDRTLGAVADEQDAIDKGRYVLLTCKGQEFMDWLEKEPTRYPDVEFVRDYPPIIAEYYDEYDVWYIHTTGPSWSPVDGGYPHIVALTEGISYQMFVRGCDGKILGSFINY
ncbi:hypothetical protein [Ruminococcus flavefaciens]|uniref:hypothetical protein n=1 Tax=Ruminococcus flavefaciens TaxID=1265 RepID=UPI0026EA3FBA|nr:hypothetical protein [Ruminococcus flavefaciens]